MKTVSWAVALHRKSGVIVDTNILLLYFVGIFDKARISTFRRTQTFVPEDFDTLIGFLQSFDKVVTLPNILSEVSNLLGQLEGKLKQACFECFAYGIDLLDEQYLLSNRIVKTSEFVRFGLTDTAIFELARANYLVLTDDFRLSQYLTAKGLAAVNFNHIRVYNWQ
jgi:rRNA-processing protein FCF1